MYDKTSKTTRPQGYKVCSCSTQLSMKFKLLIKTKMMKKKNIFFAFKFSTVVFIMLMNVKMPTIVGILTFMSMILMHESSMKRFISSGLGTNLQSSCIQNFKQMRQFSGSEPQIVIFLVINFKMPTVVGIYKL